MAASSSSSSAVAASSSSFNPQICLNYFRRGETGRAWKYLSEGSSTPSEPWARFVQVLSACRESLRCLDITLMKGKGFSQNLRAIVSVLPEALTTLCLSGPDMIDGEDPEGTRALADRLVHLTALETLRLDKYRPVNDENTPALVAAFPPSLTELGLTSCQLSQRGWEAVAARLPLLTTLHSLNLSRSAMDNQDMEVVAASFSSSLTALSLVGYHMDSQGWGAVAARLPLLTSLRSLDLSESTMATPSWVNIGHSLPTSLHTLNLADVAITGLITMLSYALEPDSMFISLRPISISVRVRDSTSMRIMTAALHRLTRLTELNLNYNQFDLAGLISMTNSLMSLNLRVLKLKACDIGEINSIGAIGDRHITSLGMILRILNNQTDLEQLDISKNDIDTSGVPQITSLLSRLTNLRSLDIASTLPWKGKDVTELLYTVASHRSLTFFNYIDPLELPEMSATLIAEMELPGTSTTSAPYRFGLGSIRKNLEMNNMLPSKTPSEDLSELPPVDSIYVLTEH